MSAQIDPIGAVEDSMVARLKTVFGWGDERRALQEVKALEFPFDENADTVQQVSPPGAYVVPFGARPLDGDGHILFRWCVYAVSGAATTRERARGAPSGDLGTYAISSRIGAALSDWTPSGVDEAGTLELAGIEVLTGLTLMKRRLSVLAVTFVGPIHLSFEDPEAELADFLHYHSDWDLHAPDEPRKGPLPLDLDATNDVDLPGSPETSGDAP